MTATDELRRLLDERGVHWWAGEDEQETLWESNGLTWEYSNNENGDAWLGFLGACEQDITPEQAITATLGRERTCRIRGGECDQCGAIIHEHANMYWVPLEDGMRTVKHHDVHYCPNCGAKVVDA